MTYGTRSQLEKAGRVPLMFKYGTGNQPGPLVKGNKMRNLRNGFEIKVDDKGRLIVKEPDGTTYNYKAGIDRQMAYHTAMYYAEEDDFVWPAGEEVPDNITRAIFWRSKKGNNKFVAYRDVADRIRGLLVEGPGGHTVFSAPISSLDLSDKDQELTERFPGWAERVWDGIGAVTFDEFKSAQDNLPEEGTDEELYPFLVAQLAETLFDDDEKLPDADEIAEAEEALDLVSWLPARWRRAIGPMAQGRKVEVRLAPYGAAAFLWSTDGERMMRLPLGEIIDRNTRDLSRIVAWLDSPRGYEAADDYEDGDTHILIWPEPYECEDARHVPDDEYPWTANEEETEDN